MRSTTEVWPTGLKLLERAVEITSSSSSCATSVPMNLGTAPKSAATPEPIARSPTSQKLANAGEEILRNDHPLNLRGAFVDL